MQLGIHKIKIIVSVFLLAILIWNCKRKSDLENQITIKINSIDAKTKQNRINKFDTIQIRIVKFGYLKKNFVAIGEYITDSKGSVKIELDPNKEYHISLYGTNVFGWANFNKNDLKDGQEVNIEASPPEKR